MVASTEALLASSRKQRKQRTWPKKVNSQPSQGGYAKANTLVGKNWALIHGMGTFGILVPTNSSLSDSPEASESAEVIHNSQ